MVGCVCRPLGAGSVTYCTSCSAPHRSEAAAGTSARTSPGSIQLCAGGNVLGLYSSKSLNNLIHALIREQLFKCC